MFIKINNTAQQDRHIRTAPIQWRRWADAAPMPHKCLVPAGREHWAGVSSVQENKEPAPAQYILHPANTKVGPALGQSCSSINDAFQTLLRNRPNPRARWMLKGLAQAEIIKKSVILFWLINMTIWCKHVHRLELQKFFNFCAAHLPVRLVIETKFPYFLFLTWLSKIRNK